MVPLREEQIIQTPRSVLCAIMTVVQQGDMLSSQSPGNRRQDDHDTGMSIAIITLSRNLKGTLGIVHEHMGNFTAEMLTVKRIKWKY